MFDFYDFGEWALLYTAQSLSRWSPNVQPQLVHHGENSPTFFQNMQDFDTELNLLCVSPEEISPHLKVSSLDWDLERAREYQSPGQIKLEMEEFKDLSLVLPSDVPNPTSSIDELNTPDFNKEFQFLVQPNRSNAKLEYNLSEYSNMCNNILNNNNVEQNHSISNEISAELFMDEMVNGFDKKDSVSVNERHYSNASPCGDVEYTISSSDKYSNIMTPEDSNSSESYYVQKPLTLMTGLIPSNIEIVNTPEVLETVASLEAQQFNILSLVSNDDITTINEEDILNILPGFKNDLCEKQSRKRKLSEDEEYVPPGSDNQRDTSDSDSDFIPSKRRGRPPKSSSSKGTSGSKYRELRDKNNEASRKSRLKRKQKEMDLEKESKELKEKNIKLKAQVEELEKMVNNFRTNLFKILIKK